MKTFKILFLSVLLIQPIKSFSANPPIVGPSTGSGASFFFETCFESGQTGGEICAFIVAVAAFITLAPPYAAVVTFRQYLENTAPLTTSDVISASNKYAAQQYQLDQTTFNDFVENWVPSAGLGEDPYVNMTNVYQDISSALQTGGTNAIGKWTLPESGGYVNHLDYMIKNNINSFDALEVFYKQMAASGSGYLPDTYTPGELIPPVVPVIPDTPPVISGNTGAGTVAYNDTYQAAISDYSVLRSMSLSDANSVIYQNYRSVTSQLEEIQAEINSGETNLADNQDQITKLEAQRAAASDTYKQMNDGQDISTYTPEV